MAMVAPTVELAEYFTNNDSPVYMYAFNHHKQPDPPIYEASYLPNAHVVSTVAVSNAFVRSGP